MVTGWFISNCSEALIGAAAVREIGDESWLPFIYPDDQQRAADVWRTVMQSGQIYQLECRVLVPHSAEYRWHLARALPARDEMGNFVR
jgi:PAS domain-containing protein